MRGTYGQASASSHPGTAGIDAEASATSGFRAWLVQDSPYIAMLLLALVGVTFHLPVGYWLFLTPVFGVICVVAGWRPAETRDGRTKLVWTQALNWAALLLATFILFGNAVQGLMSVPATSLTMLTLLALGTFVAGVQAQVWRICAVGGILFLAVPGIGWLKQSALFLVFATLVIIAIGALTWWLGHRRQDGA